MTWPSVMHASLGQLAGYRSASSARGRGQNPDRGRTAVPATLSHHDTSWRAASCPSPATARGNSHVRAGPAYRASRDRPAAADCRAPSSRPSGSSRRPQHEHSRLLRRWRQVKPTAGASVRLRPAGQCSDSGAQAARSRVVARQDHDREGPKTMNTKTRTDLTAHVRSRVDSLPRACWCGQELEHTRSRFCPRCGSASRPGTPVALSFPAV